VRDSARAPSLHSSLRVRRFFFATLASQTVRTPLSALLMHRSSRAPRPLAEMGSRTQPAGDI
jgi:hypothetical protein